MTYTIFNHSTTNLITLCVFSWPKTVKTAQNSIFGQFSLKNGHKIVTEGLIDIYLVAKESSHRA